MLAFLLALLLGIGFVGAAEIHSSRLQSHYFAKLASRFTFSVEAGPSSQIRFPGSGPYDKQLGYSEIPAFVQRLHERDFVVTRQARISSALAEYVDAGLFLAYREKTQAGLKVWSDDKQPLYSTRFPERVYPHFEAVPPILVDALLFVENRTLLNAEYRTLNPAIEWSRFARAAFDQGWQHVDSSHESAGGSTLATQIEKYRHSPQGRTISPQEKLRQMLSASVRAYLQGSDTFATREQIVVDYLNTVPLSAKPGYGEVNGIGDGLWMWYGQDFAEANRLLQDVNDGASYPITPPLLAQSDEVILQRRAQVFKQMLSLIVAQRRPSDFLLDSQAALNQLTDSHLRLLASAGFIPPALRDAALQYPLQLRRDTTLKQVPALVTRKASTAMRTTLSTLINVPSWYALDRLDLTAVSTLNATAQRAVTDVLLQLKQVEQAQAAGLYGFRLLRETDDPSKITFSFTLFERGEKANLLRVQTDNVDEQFDINAGAKLDLGSTAKLRTLITYLQIVADLHGQYAQLTPKQLAGTPVHEKDAIAQWARDYLATARDKSLRAMLAEALERRYSASPWETFYTGGGIHTFANFDEEDDEKILSVRDSFRHSVNLVFIRLMRDVARHYMYTVAGSSAQLLTDSADPRRQEYLTRFADQEGTKFIARFYKKYRGKTPAEARALLLQEVQETQGIRSGPVRLATAYLSTAPTVNLTQFSEYMRAQLAAENWLKYSVEDLYKKYGPDKFSLADRGYITGIHPLELWLVNFLQQQPSATLGQVLTASRDDRQAVYAWLFKTQRKNAQDKRIKNLLELEAFLEISRSWRQLGYPFAAITPSYAAAIGASGDRPAALAELMGIIVNKGLRLPTEKIKSLDFAKGTPYETQLEFHPQPAVRVLPEEVAEAARALLIDVAEKGTAARIKNAFLRSDGSALTVGGKTGTGDHRFDVMARGGGLISSRVIDRSATFVFMIDDRFFGTVTAFVHEPYAADYSFTSAISVQVLKSLAPVLAPLLQTSSSQAAPLPKDTAAVVGEGCTEPCLVGTVHKASVDAD
jgi:membrane peptidoglycan carboxypeptidase